MANIKDFVLKQGLVVNTAATINGVDVLANDYATYTTLFAGYKANDYSTYTTLLGMINIVNENVGAGASGYNANDYATYTTLQGEYRANDYNTYTTLQGELAANDYNTYTTLQGELAANDYTTYLAAQANDYATYTTLQGEYRANDYNTYTTLQGELAANDYNTYTTLQGELAANDYATYLAAQANDYATYTTLQSEYRANDYATYLAARANDYATYTTLQGEYRANDYNTYTTLQGELASNDYNTYTTLQGEYRANDYATYTTLQGELAANDYATYITLQGEYRANDYATYLAVQANDYATYTTLVNEYSANDYSTYTTLQGEYRANDYATWNGLNSFTNLKANSAITLTAGDGLSGGGDLSANRTFAVDATVVRTSGDQSIAGLKTFTDSVVIAGDLTVEGNTTTIGTTSLLVEDKFIELAANTTGAPVGDVGIYFNRGSEGNSAVYYDQASGYFAVVNSNDPTTNTQVSPTGFAGLKIGQLYTTSDNLVNNLNADLLDGEQGSYYVNFSNATNTNLITLAYVTANGATTTSAIEVGGLTVNTDTLHVDSANDRVGINTVTPLAELQVSNVALQTSIVTSTAVDQYTLDSWPVASFRTAKYLIQAHDSTANEYHASEVLVIHDGTTAYLTEYAIVYTSGSLITIDAAIAGGNLLLQSTPASTNTTVVKAFRQALTV